MKKDISSKRNGKQKKLRHDFGNYVIEYRDGRILKFYKEQKINTVEEALKIKEELERKGIYDARIIDTTVLYS